MGRIAQQTWDQIVTEVLAIVGIVITIGNQVGWWRIGDDTAQSIIQLLTLLAALASSLLYSATSTPNRVVDEQVAMAYHAGMADDHGAKSGLAQANLVQQSVDPRLYKGGL